MNEFGVSGIITMPRKLSSQVLAFSLLSSFRKPFSIIFFPGQFVPSKWRLFGLNMIGKKEGLFLT